jgi:hypothetical protein
MFNFMSLKFSPANATFIAMIGVIIISSKMFAQSTVEISELSVTRNTELTIFPKLERKKNEENL